MLATSPSTISENRCAALDESVFRAQLANGLTVNFVPRKGFKSGKAMLSAKVGSIDIQWTNNKGKVTKVPAGIAHYLEHQLFKKADGDLSEKFAELGAYINAHTSHTATSYYTEFVTERDQNLRLLFRLFFEPYFDQGLVDIERDIIIQEIRLYRDRPYWVSYGALLESLYSKHAIRFDIAGDEESVSSVTPAILLKTHRAFYAPSNAALNLAGDWDAEEVFATIEEINNAVAPKGLAANPERWDWQEPSKVARPYHEITMPTSAERYIKGFKLPVHADPYRSQRQELAGNLAMRLAFGAGTDFHDKLYSQGVIASDFSYGLHVERSFAYASIGGTCHDLAALRDAIAERSEQVMRKGFAASALRRALRKMRGLALARFDSVSNSADVHADAWLSGIDAFRWLDLLDELTKEDLEAAFAETCHTSPSCEVVLRRR